MARPRHVRRVTRSLGRDRLHVVVGVRDMARTVVSAWEQNIVTGSATPWREFIAAVRDPQVSPMPEATAFWVRPTSSACWTRRARSFRPSGSGW